MDYIGNLFGLFQEDEAVIELVKKFGTKNWTGLAKELKLNFKQ